MDITPLVAEHKKIIRRYGKGLFVVNEEEFYDNIAIADTQVFTCTISDISTLTLDEILAITDKLGNIELLLIGSGNTHHTLSPQLTIELQRNGINVESMTTAAACRTYNVLLSEERAVAAILVCLG